jgi:hypothetical protein
VYWWNIRGLKAQLMQGSLAQPAAFRYAAAYATLSAIAMAPGLSANQWDLVSYIAGVAITLGGTIYCYRMNGGAAGEHFLDRYFALGFVAVVRLLPIIFLTTLVILIGQEIVGDVREETTAAEAMTGILFLVIAYWRIGSHISTVAQAPRLEEAP